MLSKCPDCGGTLEEGAMLDTVYGGIVIQRYAKTTIPTDTKTRLTLIESNFEDIRRVISYRCTKCNRIFPYAQDIVLVKNTSNANKIGLIIIICILFVVALMIGIGIATGFH